MAFINIYEPHSYAYVFNIPATSNLQCMGINQYMSYSMVNISYIQKFNILSETWKHDTGDYSVTHFIVMHPAYQEIIGMGDKALPLILQELENEPRQWFWALKAISGYDPVKKSDKGNIRKMKNVWVKWGKEHGVI